MGQLRSDARAPQCHACPVRRLALFQPLSAEETEAAQKYRSEYRLLQAGDVLYRQGAPAHETYTLFSGWAFLYSDLPSGGRQVLSFVLPGDFLGFQVEAGVRGHSARILSEASLCVFPREAIVRMFREHPELGIRLVWMSAKEQAASYEHMASIGRRSALERVAFLLLEIHNRIRARQSDQGTQVAVPLTQSLIADAVGLTKVHVNRTLKRLRDSGLLFLKDGRLNIPDPDRLAEEARCSPTVFSPRTRPMI